MEMHERGKLVMFVNNPQFHIAELISLQAVENYPQDHHSTDTYALAETLPYNEKVSNVPERPRFYQVSRIKI